MPLSKRLAVPVVLAATLIAPLFAAAQAPQANLGAGHRPITPADVKSHRPIDNAAVTSAFSGLGVTGANGSFTQVSANWRVPTITYGQSTATYAQYTSSWVGIEDAAGATIIQLGTDENISSGGTATYYPWYELYPAYEVRIANPVSPGDMMFGSVLCIANCTPGVQQTWKFTMQDVTKGWTWTQNFNFDAGMAMAWAVLESPCCAGTSPFPLPSYGTEPFSNFTVNNQPAVPDYPLVMQNAYGQTSNLSDYSGGTFQTCYGYQTFTTCPWPGTSTTPAPPSSTPAPTASLVANPSSITAGQSSTLTWSSTNATSCTGTGFSPTATAGSVAVTPLQTTAYTITCTGAGGTASASATISVSQVAPTTFGPGARVVTKDSLNVRNKANTKAGKVLCTQPPGASGTIQGGPQTNQGYTWWNVNYDVGCDGWSVQDYLSMPLAVSNGGPLNSDRVAQIASVLAGLQTVISQLLEELKH